MATEPQKKAVTQIVKKIEKVILDKERIRPSGVSSLVQDDPIHLDNIQGYSKGRNEQLSKIVKQAAKDDDTQRLLVKKGADGKLYVIGGQNRLHWDGPDGKSTTSVMGEVPVGEGWLDEASAGQFMSSDAPHAFVKINPAGAGVVPHTPEQFEHWAKKSGSVSLDEMQSVSPRYIPLSLESALRSPSNNSVMSGIKRVGRLATSSWDKNFIDSIPFGSLARHAPLATLANYAPLFAGSDTTLLEKMKGVDATKQSENELKNANDAIADKEASTIKVNTAKNILRDLNPSGDWSSESTTEIMAKNEKHFDYDIMNEAVSSAVKKAGGSKEKLYSSSPDTFLNIVHSEYSNIVRQKNKAQRELNGKETSYADPSKYFEEIKGGKAAFAFPVNYMTEGGRIGVKANEGDARYIPFIVPNTTPEASKVKDKLKQYGNSTTWAFMDTAKKGHDAYTSENPFISKINKPEQTK